MPPFLKSFFSFITVYWKFIGQLVLGSGLIAIFLKDVVIETYRKRKMAKRLTRELAFEVLNNEIAIDLVIRAWDALGFNPERSQKYYRFFHNVSRALQYSGYFVHLEPDLIQFMFEMDLRFGILEEELSSFVKLNVNDRLANSLSIAVNKQNAMNLRADLLNSTEYKELAHLYRQEWKTRKLGEIVEKAAEGIDIN